MRYTDIGTPPLEDKIIHAKRLQELFMLGNIRTRYEPDVRRYKQRRSSTITYCAEFQREISGNFQNLAVKPHGQLVHFSSTHYCAYT